MVTVIGFCSMSIGYTIQALIGEYRSRRQTYFALPPLSSGATTVTYQTH